VPTPIAKTPIAKPKDNFDSVELAHLDKAFETVWASLAQQRALTGADEDLRRRVRQMIIAVACSNGVTDPAQLCPTVLKRFMN
jgi:hypothetical protein